MYKLTLSLAAAAALAFVALPAEEASAQGLHLRVGGAHINIGNRHRGHGHHGYHGNHFRRSRAVVYSPYSRGVRSYSRYSHFGGGYGISSRRHVAHFGSHGRVWHDTTHIDRIPARIVPHGNHYDYIPGRNVIHHDGHWD